MSQYFSFVIHSQGLKSWRKLFIVAQCFHRKETTARQKFMKVLVDVKEFALW